MNKLYKAIMGYTSIALSVASVIASICIYGVSDQDYTIEVVKESMIPNADEGATDEWTEEDSRVTVFHINLSHDDLYEAMFEDIAPQDGIYEHLDYVPEYTTVPITVGSIFSDITEDTYIPIEEVSETSSFVTTTSETTVSETTTSETKKSSAATTVDDTTKVPVRTTTTTTAVPVSEPREWESGGGTYTLTTHVGSVQTQIIDVKTSTETSKAETTARTSASTTKRADVVVDITTTKYNPPVTTTTATTKKTEAHTTRAPVTNDHGPGQYVDDDEIYRKMLTLLNNARAERGLPALWYSARVHEVAAVRAEECSYYYSHQRPDGNKFSTAFKDLGIKYKTCGENIAYGRNMFKTVEEVFQAWMESPSHYENIMSPNYECVAFGLNKVTYYGDTWYYWTQEFCKFDE